MKVFAIAAAVLGIAVSSAAASPQAAKPLIVRGGLGHLVMPGDRAMLGYSVYSGSNAVRGTLYVRNNRQKIYTRIALTRSNTFRVRVPNRLIRGKRLFYYAAFTDPRSGKSLRLPASGTGTTWILNKPAVVKLGTHRFGETKAPEAVVARARADQVGWDITDAFRNGPQTFQVGADGSAWLEDSINNRLLVWNPGHPDQLARSVPVPYGAGISDVVFGPAGSLYVTKVSGDTPARFMLDRLDATTGALIWEAPVAGAYLGGPGGNTYPITGRGIPLRAGPDGTLYCLVQMGLPGTDWGWMPVATAAGKPLSPKAQLRGNRWPYQPATAGLRLVGGEVYTPHDDMAPHEVRYALIDRRDRVVRSWRILSATEMNFRRPVPELAGGDPVVVIGFMEDTKLEYEVLRLGPQGAVARFSLPSAVFGDASLTDVRVGPDGKLYQLATSPETGIAISRYSLTAGS